VTVDTVVSGSLSFLANDQWRSLFELNSGSDVVLLPTAAVFSGATQAALEAAQAFEASDARVEALMVSDRSSSNEQYFAQRVSEAQWVVLLDGSPLHARTTWRETAVGHALRSARLMAIGATATVIGEEMIDPRGGAPTTGLALRTGVVLATLSSHDQLVRTRNLLANFAPLVVLEPHGVVVACENEWSQLSENGVRASLGNAEVSLARFNSR
jgi:cyanophycinase-like exopeptidase